MASSIGEIMTEKLVTITASSSAQEAAIKMTENNISSLVVTNGNNKSVGIVTERDLVTRVCVHDASSKNTTLENIMSSPLVTIDALSSVEVARRYNESERCSAFAGCQRRGYKQTPRYNYCQRFRKIPERNLESR